ncbi:hypothetical protein D6C95_03687 [Aureobasidium pullulans]|uniref:Uncharacterized protein n=1 Tax=Aureobasidium pullulans TaxID=5580 RepID=A0A4S9RXI0_AURPU|nr:hypothetical protein D6D22_10583 [Aureobasidium pullulans]THZ03570.1 hypothetical protein D6C95_03687 [Aureobasidium pullulans]
MSLPSRIQPLPQSLFPEQAFSQCPPGRMILEVPNRPPTQKDQGPMRSRGRPRKTPVTVARSPVTLAATSRNEEIGTTEVDESDAFDPGAAQPHGEVQSTRQTLPRRPKSEFDKAFSEFRSSQILRGTQPEPARPAEQVTAVENITEGEEAEEPEIMVDAATASSLSQKDSPYELETTSQSIFDSNDSSTGLAINSSSGVHTLLVPLARRYSADAIVLDSQSYNATKTDADYRSGGYETATGLLQNCYKMATDLSVARIRSSTTSKNNSQHERLNRGPISLSANGIARLLVSLRRETEAGLKFCEHIPEGFRRFRYNDPVEPFDENDQAPEAIAKGSNKLQAKSLKSDDGEEEEEEVEEEVEDGSVKVKEGFLQLLKTTLRRLRNSELLQCDSQLVRRQDGTSGEIAILEALKALGTQLEVVSTRLQALEVRLTVAPTADGASCIESDDRLPYHHVGDGGHVTPTQASPEVDGGFTIATPAANHAAFDQPALAQGSQFPKPQPAAIQTS